MSRQEAIDSIARRILAGEKDLDRLKREECRRLSISSMIKNPEILMVIPEDRLTPDIRALLLKKPVKTGSGVTPVAVMIRPQGSCRHGCIYCPSAGLAAKSYTGFEPAALRARQADFDPYLQASGRVKTLEEAGHPTDKCEVIVMGGTFLEMPRDYKESFIKGVYEGLNGHRSDSLQDAMSANEGAPTHRVVGLTIETRPDVCIPHMDEILSYGATRVELGVQHADDTIYGIVGRGHRVKEVVDSTRELKDSAFKVLYHIMPGLPGSSPEKDIVSVKALFEDQRFRPDMLKIYPALVLEGTGLHDMMKRGDYSPYSSEQAADIISEFYRHIPAYVRVMRIQRDIPAGKIDEGVKKSNLRELVDLKIKEKGITPKEIRSREAGLAGKGREADFRFHKLSYDASGGEEHFLSFEDEGLLAGFLRLRFPVSGRTTHRSPDQRNAEHFSRSSLRPEIDGDTALVRELHVYGSEARLNDGGEVQHRGFGTRLLEKAEELAAESGKDKMVVISGVGVRAYYRKRGYSREGPYMAKTLKG